MYVVGRSVLLDMGLLWIFNLGSLANGANLESGEFFIRIRCRPLVKYKGAPCQEFYRHTLFDGVCSWMWGFDQQIDYQIFTKSRAAQGVVTEEFVDLGHNYEPFNGISKIIVPQTLSGVGSFSDRLTWILRDTPAQTPYYRRFGQIFYLDDVPFLVNIVQQRIAGPYRFQNTSMSIRHLPVTNAEAIALIEVRAHKK